MAIRIDASQMTTEKLLEQILVGIIRHDERVLVSVPSGCGYKYIARIRVMMTRKKKALQTRNKRVKKFTLQSTVHPETADGIRKDVIAFSRKVSDTDALAEHLEDLLRNG